MLPYEARASPATESTSHSGNETTMPRKTLRIRREIAITTAVLSLIGLPCLALAYPSDSTETNSTIDTQLFVRQEDDANSPGIDTYDPSQEGPASSNDAGTEASRGSSSSGGGPLVQTGDYMRRERICAFILAGEAVLLLALVTRSEYDDEYVYLTLA